MTSKKEIGITILRVGMGILLLPHGFDKFLLLLSRDTIHYPAILGISPTICLLFAVFAEVGCAFCLLIGFKTKRATIPLMISLAISVVYLQCTGAWSDRELPIAYLIGCITVYFNGSGAYAVDQLWKSFKEEQAKLQLVDY